MSSSDTASSSTATPDIARLVLAGRGFSEEAIERFIAPHYGRDLHDPTLLTDMNQAVERILSAARNRERVVVYGDYDIDGMTASAIMIEGLAAHGIEATSYIPDRFEEGYGINKEALASIKQAGAQLVISVDCGITSVAEAAWAKHNGLDLIITDHHNPPPELPEAIAVINPKRAGDAYPFKELCGAGVAFKVIQALQHVTGKPAAGQEKWLLDLVALGTVCDVVDLVDENRALASFGLKVLRQTRRPGIVALAAVAGVEVNQLSAYHLGYVLGPRMNAAGRLEHASQALELLQTTNPERARVIATELDALNVRRRDEQATAFAEADAMAERYAADPVLLLADPGWSHGIVGIVASKLVEAHHKPVLVAQILGASTKGSARSLGTFNMVEALRANQALLTKFGGHFYAAGYTLPTDQLDVFRRGLCDYYVTAGATTTGHGDVATDLTLTGLGDITWPTYEALASLEPHGAGNPAPVLALDGITLDGPTVIGKDRRHVRTGLKDAAGRKVGGIGFGLAAKYPGLTSGMMVQAVGRLDVNEYQGRKSLQFIINELR